MSRVVLSPVRSWFLQAPRASLLAFAATAAFAGCSGGSGSPVQPISPVGGAPTPVKTASPTATPATTATPVATATPAKTPTPVPISSASPSGACAGGTTSSIGPAGGSVSVNAATGTLTETAAAGTFGAATTVSLAYDAASALPAPLSRAMHATRSGRIAPNFTQGAGNTYVAAFCTSFSAAIPTSALSISGAGGIVPASIPSGTQLNIAIYAGGTYVDVGTAVVNAAGGFQSTPATATVPGVTQAGTYLVYVPASGTNTTQIDLGFALLADDGSAGVANGLQFVQIEDSSGAAIPTPTTTFYPITASDLDGQSLTPDASHGAVVDGGNSVYFFSGIPQHTFVLAPNTVDVTAYGGDGDAIASLPSGDEVVVSGNGTQLAVISGILSGTPVIADAINNSNSTYDRDGLVVSTDGKILLSRGASGIDVFQVTPVAAHTGSTGVGTTSYNFALSGTFVSNVVNGIARPTDEDGRDGMAISPTDSSRAVIVGYDPNNNPVIEELTGLTGATPTFNALPLRIPAVKRPLGNVRRAAEPSAHRHPFALTPTVGTTLYAVTITPDGTTAYVSTDAGILTISGVNTGSLTQVGNAYAPTLTLPGGGTCALGSATSIGLLPDGKELVASLGAEDTCVVTPGSTDSTQGSGILVTIPIGSGDALGAPVGQLNQVVTPFNDQLISH